MAGSRRFHSFPFRAWERVDPAPAFHHGFAMTQRLKTVSLQIAKWLMFVVVLAYVARKASELWQPDDFRRLEIQPLWLLAAAVIYLVGWLPSVWFWQRVLRTLGSEPPFALTLQAYYCGHLGKYVPGKAAALVIRSALLKRANVPVSISAISATLETLGVMGVGLAIALALAPFTLPAAGWQRLPEWLSPLRDYQWLGPGLVAVSVLISVPLASLGLVKFASQQAIQQATLLKSDSDPLAASVPEARFGDVAKFLLVGSVAFVPTWLLHGLSLGCVLHAIGAADVTDASQWLLWIGAIGAGNSLGFFVLFAPGGLGVREGILIATLAPVVGGRSAVAAAALLRLVWLAAEVIAAGALSAVGRRGSSI